MNEFTSFQLSESAVTASARIEVPTCVSVLGVANVASVFGLLLKSPCTYTGFSDAIVRPQFCELQAPAVPMLMLEPLTIFRARRKKTAGFSRRSWVLFFGIAKGHIVPRPLQLGLLAKTVVMPDPMGKFQYVDGVPPTQIGQILLGPVFRMLP